MTERGPEESQTSPIPSYSERGSERFNWQRAVDYGTIFAVNGACIGALVGVSISIYGIYNEMPHLSESFNNAAVAIPLIFGSGTLTGIIGGYFSGKSVNIKSS